MARKLPESTLDRLARKLDAEHERLASMLDDLDAQRESSRLAETGSEHNADPENADGGSLAFEMEMDLSIEENAKSLLARVDHARMRMDEETYEVTGQPIPLARLEALPYATTLVEYADQA